MELIAYGERTVYELVFRSRQGKEVKLEVDEGTYESLVQAMKEDSHEEYQAGPGLVSGGPTLIEYEDDDQNDIVEEMNERLSSLGLPMVGDEEADGVDQL